MACKPSQIYQKRKKQFEADLLAVERKSNTLSSARLLIFLLAIGLAIYGWQIGQIKFIVSALPLLILFLFLIGKHNEVKNKIKYLGNLIEINRAALLRFSDQWTGFVNNGEKYLAAEHPYAGDLNVFGQGSLFQYINSTTSYMGEEILVKLLRDRADYDKIKPRQQAVKTLASKLDWRQDFQAVGMEEKTQNRDPGPLLAWAAEKPVLLNNRYIKFILLLPIITLAFIILPAINSVSLYIPITLLATHLLIAIWGEMVVRKAFGDTGKALSELQRYSRLLKYIEQEKFQDPLLVSLKRDLLGDHITSSHQIKILAKLGERNNYRQSPAFHFIINVAVFWDLRTLIKLERWKKQSGKFLHKWLKVVGEFEALSSLAILAYDNPNWAFPEVIDGPPKFETASLGHPLINAETRVCNDVSLSTPGTVFIITGSNMSGKSTLLRTIGINLVLAYAGAPVCAKGMSCSVMNIYSGMQIKDDLESKTSTFYAELKRIKLILDGAKLGEPIIFFLDEIFKGTNSKDRILGAQMLIRKLVTLPTIGLITTHDLELGALEKEHPELIKNFHFTDQIENDKISFDYRLKKGISQRTNAIALMKLIGLEIE